jgi:hypothetical protein
MREAKMLTEAIRLAYARGVRRENEYARGGSDWYDDLVQLPTERAEAEAARAYRAACQGDLLEARRCAQRACQCEAEEYGDSPTWTPLLLAIESAMQQARAAAD